jgi:hypothetical protein
MCDMLGSCTNSRDQKPFLTQVTIGTITPCFFKETKTYGYKNLCVLHSCHCIIYLNSIKIHLNQYFGKLESLLKLSFESQAQSAFLAQPAALFCQPSSPPRGIVVSPMPGIVSPCVSPLPQRAHRPRRRLPHRSCARTSPLWVSPTCCMCTRVVPMSDSTP